MAKKPTIKGTIRIKPGAPVLAFDGPFLRGKDAAHLSERAKHVPYPFEDDADDEEQAKPASPPPPRTLKEAIAQPLDPENYRHDGPPTMRLREPPEGRTIDLVREHYGPIGLDKLIPDIKVSLQSVAAVLSHIGEDEMSVLSLCHMINDEERAKQERETVPPIPTIAPRRWADRADKNQNPGQFIQEVYGKWMGHGLHTGQVRKLDAGLMKAYEIWLDNGAKDAPAGFELPTYRDMITKQEPVSPELRRHVATVARREQRLRTR